MARPKNTPEQNETALKNARNMLFVVRRRAKRWKAAAFGLVAIIEEVNDAGKLERAADIIEKAERESSEAQSGASGEDARGHDEVGGVIDVRIEDAATGLNQGI